MKNIDIWHNILWSRYKGGVFSALHRIADPKEFNIRFYQMAETGGNRTSLSSVDTSYHTYPYTLLFKGVLEDTGFVKRLKEIAIRTWKSDADMAVLTGYERPEVWAQILLLKLKRKKIMVFCDATVFDQTENAIKKIVKTIIFRSVDGVFGYGERARDYVLQYGVKPENWHKRCQAAALPHEYNADEVLAKRQAVKIADDAPRYVYVGRLSPEKNLERLLEAFVIVKKSKPNAKLVIVGGGAQEAALKDKARDLGLDPDKIFVGSKSGEDLYNEYAQSTCFVLPSLSEPWGLVVNEALHYGCPVIVSHRCGCVPELVIEGKTGFSHDPYDVSDLAAKMEMAAQSFSDIEKTTKDCLSLMDHYKPEIAASQMIEGFKACLGEK